MAKRKPQLSIPDFDVNEQRIIDEAMRIDCIKAQGVWVHSAALKWGRLIIAEDRGLSTEVEKMLSPRRKPSQ